MYASQAAEAIQVLPPDSPLRGPALRLVLSGRTQRDPSVDERLRILTDIVTTQGMNLDLLVVATRGRQMTAASLAVESPGRSAVIHISPLHDPDSGPKILVRLLRELQDQAWQRNIILLQAMADPDETRLERLFAEAGLHFLAELIYAERARGAPVPVHGDLPKLDLLTYSPERHDLFLRGLEPTYAQSLDCAGLSGVRHTRDVLAGHRATGCRDPSLWFLARLDGVAAGVLLLAPLRDRNMLEVVYMGVTRASRRRGVGHALMHKCHEELTARDFDGVTLAVDSVNTPARALYRTWGFVETGRRRAWIAVRPS